MAESAGKEDPEPRVLLLNGVKKAGLCRDAQSKLQVKIVKMWFLYLYRGVLYGGYLLLWQHQAVYFVITDPVGCLNMALHMPPPNTLNAR